MLTLNDILPGQSAVVCRIDAEDSMRRRLYDIGFIKGTGVRCIGKSPMGDPRAYLVRGAVIALRSEDAKTVAVI